MFIDVECKMKIIQAVIIGYYCDSYTLVCGHFLHKFIKFNKLGLDEHPTLGFAHTSVVSDVT